MKGNFWQYYITFEEDVDRLFRYIEPTTDNYKVYSVELTRLYLAICSEIDVIFKAYCNLLANDRKPKNIKQYAEIILNADTSVCSEEVKFYKYNYIFTPFAEWTPTNSPLWWKQHNDVKHDRDKNYKQANLENVLDALSGLYLLNLLYYHEGETAFNRKLGFDTPLEQTSWLLKSRYEVFQLHSPFLGFYKPETNG